MSCVCHAFGSVHCCLVVTCWERAHLLVLVYDVCDFVTFPCGILGQVWYLIVLIPDLCCLSYFVALSSHLGPPPAWYVDLLNLYNHSLPARVYAVSDGWLQFKGTRLAETTVTFRFLMIDLTIRILSYTVQD